MLDIRQMNKAQISAWLKEQGEPAFRSNQLWQWIWQKGVSDFSDMTNLSLKLRSRLEDRFTFHPVRIDHQQNSQDGTMKFRLKLHDGHFIEAVLIPVPDESRYTVCVSSQVGCSLSCAFCATGRMRRERNLTAAEIYDQYRIVNAVCMETFYHPLTNIVYMGMGEPLLAYRPVLESIDRLTSPDGLHISPKRITVSTAGIAKMIRKLGDDAVRFNLALSLHAANDAKRNRIMPINTQNNLEALVEAIRYFYLKTRNRISYEYIAFENFNDSGEDARELIELCRHYPVRVNIIEYNPIGGTAFRKATPEKVDRFARILRAAGIMVTVRRSRGRDINAACGQLANKG